MECTRWRKNQQVYLEVIWKENKTDDVICLHFGVYGNTCGHMIPSSEYAAHVIILTRTLTHLSLASLLWDIGKQNSPRWDAAERGVPSGAILFAQKNFFEQ